MFLSRILTSAETHYWPTELEVSCLDWMLKKVRHLLDSANPEVPPVVYTDHSSTVGIAKQTSLNTVALERLNLRLIRASQYISQFRLLVFHKPGRTNIVVDALSRLPRTDGSPNKNDADLDHAVLQAFPAVAEPNDTFDKPPVAGIQFSGNFKLPTSETGAPSREFRAQCSCSIVDGQECSIDISSTSDSPQIEDIDNDDPNDEDWNVETRPRDRNQRASKDWPKWTKQSAGKRASQQRTWLVMFDEVMMRQVNRGVGFEDPFPETEIELRIAYRPS